jgi:large subunit ribosomal protein L22
VEARAIARYVRISPSKANQVLRLIRGKHVDAALELLQFTPKAGSKIVTKTIESAISNYANMTGKAEVEELFVKEAKIGPGPILKRFRARAQLRVGRVFRRTSHITVVVASHEEKDKK